jgi:hypothetical protein
VVVGQDMPDGVFAGSIRTRYSDDQQFTHGYLM